MTQAYIYTCIYKLGIGWDSKIDFKSIDNFCVSHFSVLASHRGADTKSKHICDLIGFLWPHQRVTSTASLFSYLPGSLHGLSANPSMSTSSSGTPFNWGTASRSIFFVGGAPSLPAKKKNLKVSNNRDL